MNNNYNEDKGERRVYFSESLPTHRATSDSGTKCRRRLFAYCGRICIGAFGILLALLIIAVIFMSFLQSGLPEISIKTLQLSKFEIHDSTNQNHNNAVLDARVDISMTVRNKNDKIELSYGDIVVNVASDDVKLGKSVIGGFSHGPGNTTYLNVTTNVVGDGVDRENALEIQEEKKRVEMVAQVRMEAIIGFHAGIFSIEKVPIHVRCDDVQQFLLVNRIKEASCNIRMFPFRVLPSSTPPS
ncbi:uncharacterized protein LOC111024923 [Momordica charantia]|uniref:Uncharacterized protein LOC111024923 n=1 Tax=Momordica charantia TaxID=3673 RepID=A0A6J1E0W1_MOMCH|nr:uncharacterized protein LOC111024923 [Momordica charantia]